MCFSALPLIGETTPLPVLLPLGSLSLVERPCNAALQCQLAQLWQIWGVPLQAPKQEFLKVELQTRCLSKWGYRCYGLQIYSFWLQPDLFYEVIPFPELGAFLLVNMGFPLCKQMPLAQLSSIRVHSLGFFNLCREWDMIHITPRKMSMIKWTLLSKWLRLSTDTC